jgi:hypothetical protein
LQFLENFCQLQTEKVLLVKNGFRQQSGNEMFGCRVEKTQHCSKLKHNVAGLSNVVRIEGDVGPLLKKVALVST